MVITLESFEYLFTTDCTYSRPTVRDNAIRVRVMNLGLMKGHPARRESGAAIIYIQSCAFVFNSVSSSVRKITPYIGDPKLGNFGPTYSGEDGPFVANSTAREYAFEGVLEEPPSHVDWVIRASTFSLQV